MRTEPALANRIERERVSAARLWLPELADEARVDEAPLDIARAGLHAQGPIRLDRAAEGSEPDPVPADGPILDGEAAAAEPARIVERRGSPAIRTGYGKAGQRTLVREATEGPSC